jgi:hypothetical protein
VPGCVLALRLAATMGGQWYRKCWDRSSWRDEDSPRVYRGKHDNRGSYRDDYQPGKSSGQGSKQNKHLQYLVCGSCDQWCFDWRAQKNAYRCICGEMFEGCGGGKKGDGTWPSEVAPSPPKDDPPVTLGMLEYFQEVIRTVQSNSTSGEYSALHESAMLWVASAAKKASEVEAAGQTVRSPTLHEALKEEKRATAQRAILARKGEQHSNKIRELDKLLAAERDALAKVQEDEAAAELQLDEARKKIIEAQNSIKFIESGEAGSIAMEIDLEEAKALSEIDSLQKEVEEAGRAHRAAMELVEQKKAVALQSCHEMQGKRKKMEADVQARIDAEKAASEASLLSAEAEEETKAAALSRAAEELAAATAAPVPGAAAGGVAAARAGVSLKKKGSKG